MPLIRIVNGVQKVIPIIPGGAIPQPTAAATPYPSTSTFPSATLYPKAG